MAEAMKAQFGLLQEWDHFAESYQLFLERFSKFQMALETSFNHRNRSQNLWTKLSFLLGGRAQRTSWKFCCCAETVTGSAR